MKVQKHNYNLVCHTKPSFRSEQVIGMFGLDQEEASLCKTEIQSELPLLSEDWSIGAIVGPSGSGKSTLAQKVYEKQYYNPKKTRWKKEVSIIDHFPLKSTIKEVTHLLTSVGLSSPKAWLRPYSILSTGEKFRADLALALLSSDSVLAFDEFTSVVDRQVAHAISYSAARAIRKKRIEKKFVAISCHTDILDWLRPDWVYDMGSGQLARECLRQRPPIELEIVRCRQTLWSIFSKHHYLNHNIPQSATCYLATWDDQPVAFCAVVGMFGRKGRKRISRIVTLPDYQGLGIGSSLLESVATHQQELGFRINITASHPAVISYCKLSSAWKAVGFSKTGHHGKQYFQDIRFKTSFGRAVASFEWLGPSKHHPQMQTTATKSLR
ncbi:MAG: GNAT family N-acetyltransferase [Pirellulaceae bacterium]|nr:GNAT family N-acetyltransferase [Pirellulaceae bacterium]